jgi:exopolyphosphatase/guanosine-5'-triphosphate,3'-diphosphate pyrophosphatase
MGTEPAALAAIDVGTNSLHLVVARVLDGGRFEVIGREKEMVRLGSGSSDMKRLADDAVDRGIEALARFRKIAEISNAPVRAVATSAVREAENHDVFIRRARDEAGVEVEVISGVEEARLIHLGVLQALPVFEKRLLLCDIGGGSTELLVGDRGEVLTARSFKVGAVRLTNRFFAAPSVQSSDVESCRRYIRSVLVVYEREVTKLGHDVAIGSSGTIEQVARLVHVERGGDPLRTYNAFTMTRDEVEEVVKRLVKARKNNPRIELPGLEEKRADIILAGALVLEGVIDTFGIGAMTISDYALREGALLDSLQRREGGSLHHLRDVSRRGVSHLASVCDDDPEHSARVARLALQLFDGTTALHGLDASCRDYLEAGALLANVGLFVAHAKHHKHSYYVIRNSERLVGFTDNEIEIIAQVARYHRKSAPRQSHPEFAALDKDSQQVVRSLAALLRVAIGLDRGHRGNIDRVKSTVSDGRLVITVVPAGDADVSLDVYAAGDRSGLLSEVLDHPVDVVADGGR